MNQTTIDLDMPGIKRLPVRVHSAVGTGHVLRGRYVLKEPLGAGGRGVVFKAHDRFRAALPAEQRDIALKVVNAGAASAEEALASLRMEFHCAQLLSHRNIVNVHELDCDGDVVFYTMELLDGEPLSAIFARLRPEAMQRPQAWSLIRQLGAGVAYAHERGVVHGDLKPQNIVITRRGELRILDFGAANGFTQPLSEPGLGERVPTSGTPAYASCEQLEGRPADARDDLYALACICYELLAGGHPYDSRPATLARDYHVSLIRPRGLTGRQWRTLQRGLSWHRAARSVAVGAWMQRLLGEKKQESPMTPLQELTARKPPQRPTMWRAAMLVVAAAAVVALGVSHVRTVTSDAPRRVSAEAEALIAPAPALSARASAEPELKDPPADSTPSMGTSSIAAGHAAAIPPQAKVVAPKRSPLVISVEPSEVRSDDHFAEIRLRRNLLQNDSAFTWWTEPATAKADIDYVPESAAVQTFPSGYRATRLYIRLLPQPMRSQRAYFYIAIAHAGPHQTPATVIRRQVWLPPAASSNLHAQR